MKIMIESTDEFATVNDRPARRWRGTTKSGIRVDVFIAAIRVLADRDQAEFEAELRPIEPPPDLEAPAPYCTIEDLIVRIGHAINAANGRWPAVEKALCELSSAFVDLAPLAPPASPMTSAQEWADWNMKAMTEALDEPEGDD